MRIGLKYCGGCRARYNRVKAVEKIKAHLGEMIEIVPPEGGDIDMILAVEGCETACADLSPYSTCPIRIITKEADTEPFIQEIRNHVEG